jgi:hypothetical protein
LKVQRNKYITFMLIYASLALNLYVLLLKHIYDSEDQITKQQAEIPLLEKKSSTDRKSSSVETESKKIK